MSRIEELLLDRAAFGLSAEEECELHCLLCRAAGIDGEAYERTAAATYLALDQAKQEPIPADLTARILANAHAQLTLPRPAGESTAAGIDPSSVTGARGVHDQLGSAAESPQALTTHRLAARPSVRETVAWLAAAACLLLAVSAYRQNQPFSSLSVAEQRQRFVSQNSDLFQVAWQAQEDPAATDAAGDVVWSDQEQAGFMRFRGLASNDPASFQYQLWIFDEARDDSFPVDGGVFDIPPQSREVIVPIRAKLAVARAKMFAITVEEPGGVVVSKRERLPLLAIRTSS